MEFEQIIKRLDWLDQEQRTAKQALADLQGRTDSLEGVLKGLSTQVKSLDKKVSEAGTAAKRVEQFDAFLANQRSDFSRVVEDLEKRTIQREKDLAERTKGDLEALQKTLASLRAADDPEIRRKFKERADEASRLTLSIAEVKARVEELAQADQEVRRAHSSAADIRTQDLKRIAEMQGELAAFRKRADEFREQSVLQADTLKNIEGRLSELVASEATRMREQAAFIEGQARSQVERERGWKDWAGKYESLAKQAEAFESQFSTVDETMRAAKRAQETYQELNTKLERRINEITELQRLGEDRLRQEWIAFKSDDQKRWTGHTLAGEEATRDVRKELQKTQERLGTIQELAQTLQDQLVQTADANEQQLRELVNVFHEWMTSYERIMGHTKKPARK